MAMTQQYTDSQIADIISWRNAGHEWAEVARRFSNKYDDHKTSDAVRGIYRSYKHVFETTSDDMLVKNLRQIVRTRNTNSSTARENRAILNHMNLQQDMLEAIKEVVEELPTTLTEKKKRPSKVKKPPAGKPMTIELLFSDWQIGKLMDGYDSDIAQNRLEEYTEAALQKIKQYQELGYNVERIVLAMLGDIIESSEKHKNSARATDCSTPAQIQKAITGIYCGLLEPLSELGIPVDVYCIPGNHDWNDHGLNMYRPGEEHYSWVIYNTLSMLCEHARLPCEFTFHVTPGCFDHTEIYGHTVVYEHGVGVSVQYAKMQKRLEERARQIQKFVTYYRMGDKHNISRFNEDTLVVNGAFFGGDKRGTEYSSINGYASCAGQIMFAYVPRDDDRLPLFDSFTIQLQHIK